MNIPTQPEDPIIRDLVARSKRMQLTRRAFIAGASGGAAALLLAACAPSSGGVSKPTAAADRSANDKIMNFSNWSGYMDTDAKGGYPTLAAFQKSSGIKVNYTVDIDDNNSYYGKVKDQLALGQDIGADGAVLTNWMIARWIRLGYAQAFDDAKIPNKKNLVADLQNPDFDPGRKYSLPWQGGFSGLCWNKEVLPKGLHSIDDLFDPALKGRISVLAEMRDTIGLIMLQSGVDASGKWGDNEWGNAIDILKKQVSSGQIRNIKGNSYLEDFKSGDIVAAIGWSGDITSLNTEVGDKFAFALPDAGGISWNDNFLIPIGSQHKANAEAVINNYYDPVVAAQLAAYVNFITPVQGAREEAEKIDPTLANNPLVFPDAEILKKTHVFRTLSPAEEQKYQADFLAVGLGA